MACTDLYTSSSAIILSSVVTFPEKSDIQSNICIRKVRGCHLQGSYGITGVRLCRAGLIPFKADLKFHVVMDLQI